MGYHDAIAKAQRVLRVWGGYSGEVDGEPGPLSLGAAARVPHSAPTWWPAGRRVIAAGQAALAQQGQKPGPIDGLWGPQTDAAFEIWVRRYYTTRPYIRPDADLDRPGSGGRFGTEATMTAIFGAPGNPRCTAGRVAIPWAAVLAWDESAEVEAIACHEDVAPSLARVLEHVADTHTTAEIRSLGLHLWGGCYNLRRKRGGSDWSTHAYGVALDWDPARNRLAWGADRARLARVDADRWWGAWAAEGWCSLGQVADFDWMHVQAPAR